MQIIYNEHQICTKLGQKTLKHPETNIQTHIYNERLGQNYVRDNYGD